MRRAPGWRATNASTVPSGDSVNGASVVERAFRPEWMLTRWVALRGARATGPRARARRRHDAEERRDPHGTAAAPGLTSRASCVIGEASVARRRPRPAVPRGRAAGPSSPGSAARDPCEAPCGRCAEARGNGGIDAVSGAGSSWRTATNTSARVAPRTAAGRRPSRTARRRAPRCRCARPRRGRAPAPATCSPGYRRACPVRWRRVRGAVRRGRRRHQLREAEVEHLHEPSGRTITLPGLMSRWTMPAPCAAARADAIWMAMSRASAPGRGSTRR